MWLLLVYANLAGLASSAGKACAQVGADDMGAPICPHEPLPGELGAEDCLSRSVDHRAALDLWTPYQAVMHCIAMAVPIY